jgi:alanine dehydrogenase
VSAGADAVWADANLILKVKEPLEVEYPYLEQRGADLTLFTYLHLSGVTGLAAVLCRTGTTAVAYETVETESGEFPLLAPMSDIAGQLAVHAVSTYLRRPLGTRGMLISGVAGVPPAKITIIGAGVVGQSAARLAMAMGAEVTLLNRSSGRLRRFVAHGYPGSLRTNLATATSITEAITTADAVIGGVYVGGARATHVISREMLSLMSDGAVIVDVSIDQGGCFETSHATTYEDPVYEVDGVIHYCVANMPGAVPQTATLALTNETLQYVRVIAEMGVEAACAADPVLARGLNAYHGKITNEAVANAVGLEFAPLGG